MDINKIKELALLMNEQGLTGIEICEGDSRVSLSKSPAVYRQAYDEPTGQNRAEAPAFQAASAGSGKDDNVLCSPLVGCVYLAPDPESSAFVSVGSNVSKGQVLCIVEAMKVMNEFTAPRDGRILEILVENEDMVEYGQPLFRLA